MLPGEPTYNRGIQILPKISQEDLHPCKHRATEHESWGIQYREWKAPSAYGRWYSAGIQITCRMMGVNTALYGLRMPLTLELYSVCT